jgi:hypothetical protein
MVLLICRSAGWIKQIIFFLNAIPHLHVLFTRKKNKVSIR